MGEEEEIQGRTNCWLAYPGVALPHGGEKVLHGFAILALSFLSSFGEADSEQSGVHCWCFLFFLKDSLLCQPEANTSYRLQNSPPHRPPLLGHDRQGRSVVGAPPVFSFFKGAPHMLDVDS